MMTRKACHSPFAPVRVLRPVTDDVEYEEAR